MASVGGQAVRDLGSKHEACARLRCLTDHGTRFCKIRFRVIGYRKLEKRALHASRPDQRTKLARMVQGVQFIRPADVAVVDKDLRNRPAAQCALRHLLP